MSKLIKLEKLNNTRDLGGMVTASGKSIKDGMLFRSGHLFFASPHDQETLAEKVKIIVDFRTDQECYEKPDPKLPEVEYHHIPIISNWTAGVTWEEKPDITEEEVLAKLRKEPKLAKEYMCGIYRSFILNEFYISQYNKFLKVLIENTDKPVLWHCTAGKDRAGFGSVIIQEILGVPRETIIDDYMMTNVYLADEIKALTAMLKKELGDAAVTDESLVYMFGADADYINTLYKEVEHQFGDFENFISDGLKISKYERDFLCDRYLA